MNPPIDLTGQKFGRLLILARANNSPGIPSRPCGQVQWRCRCDCGSVTTVKGNDLKRKVGKTKSCGCLRKTHAITHGMRRSPEYGIWRSMISRCTNPNDAAFFRYGGRGIEVSSRYRSFVNFFADLGPRPSPALTLERIDNSGHYEPGNVKWATRTEQAHNRRARSILMVTFRGQTLPVTDWAKRQQMRTCTLRQRLKVGWTIKKALLTPVLIKKQAKRSK